MNIARRSIGLVLTAVTFYALAWLGPFVGRQVENLGGSINVLLIIGAVGLLILKLVWPYNRRPRSGRVIDVVVTLLLVLGVLFNWGAGIAEVANDADWGGFFGSLAILLGILAWAAFLWFLTVPEHPVNALRRVFRRR
jgi:hypothetical protein